jgi:raffinose/stachyose/melibiose transport system substrate-binding protein
MTGCLPALDSTNKGSYMFSRNKKRVGVAVAALATTALVLSGCAATTETGSDEEVSISVMFDNAPNTVAYAEALIAAFEEANPNIKVSLETRPGGTEGDNLVKTKLATGEMNDVFGYNSGSLFQVLNADQTLVEISGEAWASKVVESFWDTVSTPNGKYGAPYGTAMGGGILYNKKVYADLGLSVPMTWAEFMANNDKIKAAGIDPVIQTYGDDWTSQLFVLADFHNVAAEEPNFVEEYTNNIAKYATSPAAIRGFEYLEELNAKGYYNSDYASATFPEGLVKLANGEGAHFPMLTGAISAILEGDGAANINDVGFFAQPGQSAATNGLTVWMPSALYIPKTTEGAKLDAAKKFLAFAVSTEGIQAYIDTNGQTGPFLTKDAPTAGDLYAGYADMFPYFEREGATTPALEFLTAVKGPGLPQITVATGIGQYSGAEAAAVYDEDVKKQAQQLGLPGW